MTYPRSTALSRIISQLRQFHPLPEIYEVPFTLWLEARSELEPWAIERYGGILCAPIDRPNYLVLNIPICVEPAK